MRPKIMLYRDDVSAAGMMNFALRASFHSAQYDLHSVNINDIRHGILDQPSRNILVLPGIFGEDSRYHDDFGAREFSSYMRFLHRGGVSLNSCAGASAVAGTCVYNPPWRPEKKFERLKPLFKGVAIGPVTQYAVQPGSAETERNISDLVNTSIAPVLFKTQDGNWEEAHISYGNGPVFIPNDPGDSTLETLAIYPEAPGQPISLLRIAHGSGAAYLCSMHPENRPMVIAPSKNPRNPAHYALALSDALKPHEAGRQKFWSTLTGRMKADLKP